MRLDINPIPKGHHVAITTGQYSDFSLDGVYVAKETIDVEAEIKAYIAAHPDAMRKEGYMKGSYIVSASSFLAWLHGRSLLEKVDCFDLYLGGYDNDPDDFSVSEVEG